MSLRKDLEDVLALYEEIRYEMDSYKSNEYKQGIIEGMTTVLDAVKVCLEENDTQND
ncbi:hypothetical protein GGQ84_000644 [Desulfitispora alkaliphila]|uniref:hypothetical protein n=1 Tax=Desulfitispora alkaliphila TaxID=622674 RepID=UPI003D22EACA